MSWYPLPTDRPDVEKSDLNQVYLDSLKGELTEEEARVTLGGFLRYNLGFLVRMLTGLILYPDQRIIVKGWLQKNFTLTVAGRGHGKCIDENSTVLTENGFKPIKDTYVGEKIWADKGFQPIEAKTVNPKENGFEITTRTGLVCRGKIGHKIYYLDHKTAKMDWKNIEDFDGTEIIPIRHGMGAWGNKNPISGFKYQKKTNANSLTLKHESEIYYLMGLILGDGCLRHTGGTIGITSENEEIASFIHRIIPTYIDGATVYNSSKEPDSKAKSIEFSSRYFKNFLYYMGFNHEKAHKKTFPKKILGTSEKCISSFLRGLYDTDGYAIVEYNKKRNRWTGIIGLTSASWDIIKTTQSLLLNYGIVAYIHHVHKAGPQLFSNGKIYETNDAWSLIIGNKEHIKRFSERIGFGIKYKQDNINEYLLNVGPRNYHYNLLPLGTYFRTKYRPHQFRHKGIKLHKSISYIRLKEIRKFDFLDEEDKNKLDAILANEYYFDSIKKIKPIETVSVDIQVANEKCYWSEGFINHNSFLFSHFCYLYCLFNPGRHIVMVSAQFRSSRKILENIDGWSRAKPDWDAGFPGGSLLKQTIDGDMLKKPDKYVIKFKNGSTITAVPLGDPNRLRGLRANVLGIDEGLLIPESTINNVLKPFLFTPSETEVNRRQRVREREDREIKAGRLTENQCEVFKSENKMIILSSASYSWEYLFEVYKKYLNIIHGQEAAEEILGYSGGSYLVHQLSWKTAPEDRVEKAIKQEIESGMYSEATIKREYEGQFISDSDAYFRASKMQNCTIEDGKSPCIEIKGEPNAEYILGIDQSSSDSETSDHFAMCVLKVTERVFSDGTKRKIGMVVHQYAEAGDTPLKEHIEYLYYILTSFNIVYIGYDASQGANLGFINICNESELFREKKLHLDHIEADFGKENYTEIISQVQQGYNRTVGRIVQPQQFHSNFQRAANEYLQACFDGRNIVFAGKPRAHKPSLDLLLQAPIDHILEVHSSFNAKSEDGNAMVKGPKDEFIVNQEMLMDLVKKECALIELKSNALGHLSWDLPSHMKRAGKTRNKVRKDSYSALLLANWCLYIYTNAMSLPPRDGDTGFAPVLLGGPSQYPWLR